MLLVPASKKRRKRGFEFAILLEKADIKNFCKALMSGKNKVAWLSEEANKVIAFAQQNKEKRAIMKDGNEHIILLQIGDDQIEIFLRIRDIIESITIYL